MKNIVQNNTKPSLKSKALIKQHRDQVTQEIFTYKQRIDDSYFRMSKCAKVGTKLHIDAVS